MKTEMEGNFNIRNSSSSGKGIDNTIWVKRKEYTLGKAMMKFTEKSLILLTIAFNDFPKVHT